MKKKNTFSFFLSLLVLTACSNGREPVTRTTLNHTSLFSLGNKISVYIEENVVIFATVFDTEGDFLCFLGSSFFIFLVYSILPF